MPNEPYYGFMRKSPLMWQQFVGVGLLPDQTFATIITIGDPKQMTTEAVERRMEEVSLGGEWTMARGIGSSCRFIITRLGQLKASTRALHEKKFEWVTQLKPGTYNINDAKRVLGIFSRNRHADGIPKRQASKSARADGSDADEKPEYLDPAEEQLRKVMYGPSKRDDDEDSNLPVEMWSDTGPQCSPCIRRAAENHRQYRHRANTLYLKPNRYMVEVGVKNAGEFCRIGVIQDVERTANGHMRLRREPWDG